MRIQSLSEILEKLSRQDDSGLTVIRITVLRNVTVETIEPYLRYFALQDGLAARVTFGGYDAIFQEASGAGRDNLLDATTNVVLVYFWLPSFSPGLTYRFATLKDYEVQEEVARVQTYAAACIRGIRSLTPAFILWHGIELPAHPSLGILDQHTLRGQSSIVHELNSFLASELHDAQNGYLVDLTQCVLRLGVPRFYDWRYWHIGRAPFSREALCEIAQEDHKYVRALVGKTRKCLVLDCDDVLWGGIVGEDGPHGIKLGPSHPGSAYVEFQHEVLNLYHRGVILAICSRNNAADVLRVLRHHPNMVLREEHFASLRANWLDKATNIKAIANELNIGLDSLVFVDDSEFEIDLVRAMLPEVEVIHLPVARATENRARLAACGLFDSLSLSEEDRRRGEMYRAEVRRKEQRTRAADLPSYLRSLDMRIWIGQIDAETSERAAQLTQRTNQFNLTTKRYTVADMQEMARSPDRDVFLVRLADRFGDYGLVGVAILTYHGEDAEIDTFLLSCRVLGRQVEDVLLDASVRAARRRGASRILGRYVATKKNEQVREFLQERGFAAVEVSKSGGVFELSLDRELTPFSQHFAAIEIVGEEDRA